MEAFTATDLPVKLDLSIKHIIEKENFTNSRIKWRRVTVDGGNYIGILYEIDVSGRTEDEDKELHLFAKHITDESSLNFINFSQLYVTEYFAYNELFKIFDELQESANIPLKERYQTVKIYEESNEKAIIMENIAKKGFIVKPRINVFDNDYNYLNFLKLSIKQLAKFHGLSFALQEKMPKYFAEKIKTLKHHNHFAEDWRRLINKMQTESINYVDEKFKTAFNKVYEGLKDKYCQYRCDQSIQASLCHGDYRSSNIMVTENEDENQEIIVIDYQMMHFGCPVFDFLNIVFKSTDSKFRKAHLINLKNLYYETFSNFLKYFDLEANKLYPREVFEKVYKEKLDYGLMVTVFHLPFMLATGTGVPDLSKPDWKLQYGGEVAARYQDLLKDFIEWGYI